MNTDVSSLIDIRELALGAFSGLPRPYCKKKSIQRRPVPFGPRLPSLGDARFDDCASDCAALALLRAFTAENLPLELGQWSAPTVDQDLQAIFAQLMATMTDNGDPFTEALREHHRELFVGVINADTNEMDEVVFPGGRGFAAGPVALKYHPTQILASAAGCSNRPPPKIPTFRWDFIKKRFSLPRGNRPPGTNYVTGPYLLVGIPETETGTLAKGRMWPVWFSALHRRMSIIRSNLERGGCAAAADLNAVVLTFIYRLQLIGLQEAFGGRWAGDLASYPYLADYGLMPLPYHLPGVGEAFGVRALKRYDIGKVSKKAHGEQNRRVRFMAFEGKRLDEAMVYSMMSDAIMDPANGIWHMDPRVRAVA